MLDPSAPRASTAARFHREGILSRSRPGPRGVSSLWLQGPGLPVRSWKDLPTRPPFATPQPGSAPRPSRPRAPGTERCRPGPSPTRRGGMSDLPTGSPSPLLLSFFLLRDPAGFRAHLSPLDSVPSFPKAWVREGVSCFFPPWLAQRPADGGTRQVPATKIRLLSTERSLGVPREYLAICI